MVGRHVSFDNVFSRPFLDGTASTFERKRVDELRVAQVVWFFSSRSSSSSSSYHSRSSRSSSSSSSSSRMSQRENATN